MFSWRRRTGNTTDRVDRAEGGAPSEEEHPHTDALDVTGLGGPASRRPDDVLEDVTRDRATAQALRDYLERDEGDHR